MYDYRDDFGGIVLGVGGVRNAGGTILGEGVWWLAEVEANSIQTDV
jgi:hypothetical protein